MKATLSRKDMTAAVVAAARYLSSRPPTPTLAHLRLTAADGHVAIEAYDLDRHARATAAASVGEPGSALVDGRQLADLARTFPRRGDDHDVRLATYGGSTLVLETAGTRVAMPLTAAEDYPTVPRAARAAAVVDAAALYEAAGQVARAASGDETLPALTGIHLRVDDSGLRLLATDRYRIAYRTIPCDRVGDAAHVVGCLAPAASLRAAAKSLRSDGEVTIGLPEPSPVWRATDVITLLSSRCAITFRRTEGKLPKQATDLTVLPRVYTHTVQVPKEPLAAAVQRAIAVAGRYQPVRLDVADGQLALVTGAAEQSGAVTDSVPADLSGSGSFPRLSFHSHYLLDALHGIKASAVQIHLPLTSSGPALLHAVGADATALRHALMPVSHRG
jgi:DNA polymerase-3 subunit beta